jgi:HPt (histidine-containing phosphotransfer) domain-containing protein
MDGYISKPINQRELIKLVEGLVADERAETAPTGAQPAWSAHQILERLGGDEDLARQLVALFITECPRMLTAVRESVQRGSGDELRRAAHAFKGSVANFVEGGPTATALELELLGRANRPDQAAALLTRLEQETAVLLERLREFEARATCAS